MPSGHQLNLRSIASALAVIRTLETHADEALCGEVVDLGPPDLLHRTRRGPNGNT
jgi:hypothetical protein